jgi:hypothetical protein
MGKGQGLSVTPVNAGVRADLNELLRRFCLKESLRFQKFAAVFQEMKMSTVFCGRQNRAELTEVRLF